MPQEIRPSVTLVYCGQTAYAIGMIFGTHLALDNSDHVLDGGPNPPTEGGTSPR